ncbi:MAG: SNF2-related protein [Promicromonosporaceae bacterium]|nr:SNF2-related protein [Promicromonosporaceae bacterium]
MEESTLLYDHQKEGVRHLVKNKGVGTLHFDPGTGKTLTLAYLSALARKKGTVTGLVVAPLAAVGVWPEEAEKWVPEDVAAQVWNLGGTIKQKIEQIRTGLPDPKLSSVWERQGPFDAPALILWIINVDALPSRTNKAGENLADKLLSAVKKVNFDVMVVDELHQYRRGSNRQRLATRIAKVIPRRIGLTGTPMPKGPEDMYRQMQIIDPELFKMMNYMQFLNEFCVRDRVCSEDLSAEIITALRDAILKGDTNA